ncbi:MAG: DinB family protein [Ignavibacteriaceae bacterium]
MTRPVKGDYSPNYEGYISKVEGENGIVILKSQLSSAVKYFDEIPEDKGTYSYAIGKWSIKELIGHIIDTERVFAYRAMCIARGETKSLPGFDQDDYVKSANFNEKKLNDLVNEFKALRESNITMFNGFDEVAFDRRGLANEKEITVLAILFIICGHAAHHLNILEEKYLK